MWIRDFVNSIIANYPSQTAITTRLYAGVPLDFYNALIVFYGPEVAEEFLGILSRDILRIWRVGGCHKKQPAGSCKRDYRGPL